MIHKNKSRLGQLLTIIALTTLLAGSAGAQQSAPLQCLAFVVQSGGSGSGCPGAYTGYAKMTNSAGTFWITPPTNTVSGTLTNLSGLPDPFVGVACVKCNDLVIWCQTNSVTFPATNTKMYQLTVYSKSTPAPTNGQPMSLQIIWK